MPQIKRMFIAQRSSLAPVKILVSNSFVHLELFENKKGNLFLSSTTENPAGITYYATMPSIFCAFLESLITLQDLFNQSPSAFVEISTNKKTALYSLKDADILLTSGDKTLNELLEKPSENLSAKITA